MGNDIPVLLVTTCATWYTCQSHNNHPVKFDGKSNPDVANQWLKDLERICDAKMCPAENRLTFSVYMLTGDAKHWWINTKSILEERDEQVTWEAFRERFLSEYFLDSIWYAKEVEFLQLTQGRRPWQSMQRDSSTSAASTPCHLMRNGDVVSLRMASTVISV